MAPRRRPTRPRRGRSDPGYQPDRWQDRLAKYEKHPYLDGKKYERIRQFVFQRDRFRCHACGHFGSSLSGKGLAVDHDPVPLAECEAKGVNPLDPNNMKTIHGDPCPTCAAAAAALGNRWSGRCNSAKGALSVMAFRIKAANATGLKICGVEPAKGPPSATRVADVGERDWL